MRRLRLRGGCIWRLNHDAALRWSAATRAVDILPLQRREGWGIRVSAGHPNWVVGGIGICSLSLCVEAGDGGSCEGNGR